MSKPPVMKDGVRLTGKVPASAVLDVNPPRPDPALIRQLEAIDDLTGTLSDVLDEMGINRTIPASVLGPSIPGRRVIGPAITVRNVVQATDPYKNAQTRSSRLAEIEGHNLARPGDVLVMEGIAGISNMGGISATIGKRQGELGAIVDGGIRDLNRSRELGFPVWSRGPSPITGKWRIETVLVNGPVHVCGVKVEPGDLAVADDTGVCFVPLAVLPEVVKRAVEIADGEGLRLAEIDSGLPIPNLASRTYVYQYAGDAPQKSPPAAPKTAAKAVSKTAAGTAAKAKSAKGGKTAR